MPFRRFIMRYSKQRELVLKTVLENKIHPNAEFVYNTLKEEYPELSLGTVYRNLNSLVKNNMLKKISIPRGSDCFDGTIAEHQHLICTKCGKIIDVCIMDIDKIQSSIYKKTGFNVNCSSLTLEGICKECEKDIVNSDTL